MADLAGAIQKGLARHERKPHDLYETPFEATHALIPMLRLPDGATVGEPACATGKIARVLEAYGYKVISSDLRHTGYGEGGCDYLSGDDCRSGSLGLAASKGHLDAIITNPPFKYAEQFIRRAVHQAPIVAMLLKSDFWNAAGRMKLWKDHTPTAIYPLSWRLAFLKEERGNNPIMNVQWVVWDEREPKLLASPLAKPDVTHLPKPADVPLLTKLMANAEARERLDRLIA